MRVFAGFVLLTGLAAMAAAQGLEDQAKELEGKIIAPCCWVQPVSQHYSREADEIRAEIRRMLSEGQTSQQILDFYVAKYGERILASPRARGFNILAYALPYVSLGLGIAVLVLILRRLRTKVLAVDEATVPAPLGDSKYTARLDRELRELDDA